ncbi:MAG: hypothetical protein KAI66_23220, partial [Lentisphaeria bacterium]|nr:hypothetical protein [Lentisphaeria bacterium]
PETGTCQPRCAEGEYYIADNDSCEHVPECLRNAMLGETSGDCEGWPFYELSLDTLCARRAFNICDSIFDCGCAHGGYASDGSLMDRRRCLAENYFACDAQLAPYPERVALGKMAVVPQGLVDFDAYYSIPAGVCTRPVGWQFQPSDELIKAMFEGAVPRDGECAYHMDCAADDYCIRDEDFEPSPLDPPYRLTCQPRPAAGELCQDKPCAGDLICMPDIEGGGESRCMAKRTVDQLCGFHSDCAEGLYCYPANLSDYLAGNTALIAEPSCQNPMVAGEVCPGDAWQLYQNIFNSGFFYNPNQEHALDLCGPTRTCRGARPGSEFIGICEASTAEGEACDWCGERAFTWDYRYIDDPYWGLLWMANEHAEGWRSTWTQAPFSACAGGMTCVYDSADPINRGRCASQVSVCPYSEEEIYEVGVGGICSEICNDGIDNDRDGLEWTGDADPEVTYIDCDDPDCVINANCFEYTCDDGLDNDGDSPDGLANIDCDDFDCCYAGNSACNYPDPDNPGNNIGIGLCNEAGQDGANC